MSKLRTTLFAMTTASVLTLAAPCWAQGTAAKDQAEQRAIQRDARTAARMSRNDADIEARYGQERRWNRPFYAYPPVYNYSYANPYPYSYGYGYSGRAYYPYGFANSGFGYPIDLNSGYLRGYRYGNIFINPNFGN